MADYITEVRLRQQLVGLEAALARSDRLAATYHAEEINRLRANIRPRPRSEAGGGVVAGMPGWIRSLARERGVRISALEKAIGARKVVVTGRMGDRNMLELKVNF